MKKFKKIMIMVIIVILLITTIFLIGIHILSQYETYTGVVESIDDNGIRFNSPHQVGYTPLLRNAKFYDENGNRLNISDIDVGSRVYIFFTGELIGGVIERKDDKEIRAVCEMPYIYSFSAKDVKIEDSEGHRINLSDINIGDTIYVINKKSELNLEGGSEKLRNVKLIKVLSKASNQDN